MTSNDNLFKGKLSANHERSSFENEICVLNQGEEDEMEIYGYQRSVFGTIFTWILIVASLGTLRLVFHWYKHWMLYSTHRKCALKFADKVVVIDRYQKCHTSYFVKKVDRISLQRLSAEDVRRVSNDQPDNGSASVAAAAAAHSGLANESRSSLVRIYFSDGSFIDESDLITITVKKLRYVWRRDENKFSKIGGIEKSLTKSDFHNNVGYSTRDQLLRRVVYGKNEIQIELQSIGVLMLLEFLNPFYIFQVFSLILWFVELYLYYSFAIIAMSLFGIVSSAVQTQKNQKQLDTTVRSQGTVTVCRKMAGVGTGTGTGTGTRTRNESAASAVYEQVAIGDLVPGDVILIPRSGFVVPCDAVLLCGNCIVNESMLTGESVPVTKTALPNVAIAYDENEDENHTLYGGTQVLQARYYADENIHAVVLRTGYLTAKGSLVRSILYPIPHDFKFDRDIYKFVWALGAVAVIGSVYSAFIKIIHKASLFDTVVDSLDIVTIVVPPALPAAMTVGKYYAQSRLQKQKISCMNTSVINVSGSVNCICFDKTGTLTEDGLDLYGVIPARDNQLRQLVDNVGQAADADLPTNFVEAMATCHSLTLINDVISGDPLDVKMFESTGWILDETELTDTLKYDLLAPTVVKAPSTPSTPPTTEDGEIGVIHQFQFSSRLQRMSVITKKLSRKDFTVYCKGSPEMIESLCEPNSVPENLHSVLEKQTEKGYRVIAIAYKTFPALDIIKLKRLHRNQVERDLIFVGLVIFENKLKPETVPVIADLKQAHMKLVMLTGDNIQTAICVAKESGIIAKNELVATINVNQSHTNGHIDDHGRPELSYTLRGDGGGGGGYETDSSIFQVTSLPRYDGNGYANGAGPDVDLEMGLKIRRKDCKFALTGHVWSAIRQHFASHVVAAVLANGVIFARMSADQKQQVIQELQNLGYYVAMCGDGANDCGALKTADVGISLSEAESSVASPFTSQQAHIGCVPKVVREGRAALVTSFGLFKFMILYSLLEFFSTVLLYGERSALSDFEFLYIDVFLIVVFAFFFGQTRPYGGALVSLPPSSSLLSATPILSLLLQTALMVTVQIVSLLLIKRYPWYGGGGGGGGGDHREFFNYDNYAVYTVSQFQYIILAVTFSFGKPYREPVYKNVGLFWSLIAMTLVSCAITLTPPQFVRRLFQLKVPSTFDSRLEVVGLASINAACSLFAESVLVNVVAKKLQQRRRCRRRRRQKTDDATHADAADAALADAAGGICKSLSKHQLCSSDQHLSQTTGVAAKYYGTMDSYNFI